MDLSFKEAFTFMFRDKCFWKKYLVGTFLIILVSLLLQQEKNILYFMCLSLSVVVICGYFIYYSHNKIMGGEDILPKWGNNIFVFLKNGFKSASIIIFCCFIIWAFIPMLKEIFFLSPFIIFSNPFLFLPLFWFVIIVSLILLFKILFFLIVNGAIIDAAFLIDLKFKSLFNTKLIKKKSKNKTKLSFYFSFLIFLIIIGIIFIKKIPIISVFVFWTLFYFLCVFQHLKTQYIIIELKN